MRAQQRQMFSAGPSSQAEPGQAVFQGPGSTFSWVVPNGVWEISAVIVSHTSSAVARISRGGTDLLNTTHAIGSGNDGGGNGGLQGADMDGVRTGSVHASRLSGGGAGGYSGNGGNGGDGSYYNTSLSGGSGSGGGGGGGAGYAGYGNGTVYQSGGLGGGVGLLGIGSNGTGGSTNLSPPASGGHGSNLGNPIVGAGSLGSPGGNLRYRNRIPVLPGETLTITLSSSVAPNASGQGSGARIMWGGGRSYPSNAGNAVPTGQVVITGDTTWTVPAGVTTVHAAAQDGQIVVNGVVVLRAANGARIGDGGGDGGQPGRDGDTGCGGGGAGGYQGDGGRGGAYVEGSSGNWIGGDGTGGQGGGGGGGGSASRVNKGAFGGGSSNYEYTYAGPGGGVGISGIGDSGGGGFGNSNASAGSAGSADACEGVLGGGSPGQPGAALAWKNNIAVTPGQVISVSGLRVRIIWGPNRSYPYAAGKV